MNIIISAGGRFHAHHLAQQLVKRDSLMRFYTFSAETETNRIKNYCLGSWLDWVYFKLRINKLISPSRYNTYKDILFDHWVSKQLKHEKRCDIFVGWANYVTESIPVVRRLPFEATSPWGAQRSRGAKIIIESGSCHIAVQQKLLQQEYDKLGLTYKPITQKNRERMEGEYAQADYIMTLSSFARNSFLSQGFAAEKILQVPCGIDVEYFDKPVELSSPKKFIVIFVGLLSIRKGIHHLIEAWQQLNLPLDRTQLLLVGTMQRDLQQVLYNKQLNSNIIFYGPTSRVTLRTLYQQASVFVLPSIEDGFGMVMGEAMASGLPVICSRNTGAPDVITHGNEGFLVNAGDVRAFAEKISWCYEYQQQACEMGFAGRETIKNYTWDVYGERVYDLYKKLCT